MTASLDRTFEALADPTRRQVIELLRQRPRRPAEMAARFQISPPALSRHLRVLRLRGLIEEETGLHEDARIRTYRLKHEPFVELQHWLDGIKQFWTGQLDAFNQHTERTRGKKR